MEVPFFGIVDSLCSDLTLGTPMTSTLSSSLTIASTSLTALISLTVFIMLIESASTDKATFPCSILSSAVVTSDSQMASFESGTS